MVNVRGGERLTGGGGVSKEERVSCDKYMYLAVVNYW